MSREELYRKAYDAFVEAGGADNSYAEEWVKAVIAVAIHEAADVAHEAAQRGDKPHEVGRAVRRLGRFDNELTTDRITAMSAAEICEFFGGEQAVSKLVKERDA